MGLSREDLVGATVSGIQILDDAIPAVAPLDTPGVEGRITAVSHPFPNGVSLSRLDAASADATIRHVIDTFAAQDKAFGWFVGPGSTPEDLPARLEAAGLQRAEEWAGLVLTNLADSVASSPGVRVEQVRAEELRAYIDMIVNAFGYGTDRQVAEVMVGMLEALEKRRGGRVYLAFGSEEKEPMGFSVMTGTHHPAVMNLALAATLEEHRGRGVYRSLVARRVADARSAGAEALVTQANRETSAPILQKLGFADICSFDLYAWMPSGS